MAASNTKSKLNRACLVVFSGGQDSTTCLHWALRAFTSVEGVFFDYGQRHKSEVLAAQAIALKVKIPLRLFRLDFFRELKGNALTDSSMAISSDTGPSGLPNTFVPGRNLLFLTQAASYAYTQGIKDIVTGVCQTDYSGYPDCRVDTIKALQKSLHLGLGWPERHGTLRLHTPLMFKTKAESVRLAEKWGAMESLAFSHTCYEGTVPPCGRCPACILRAKGFAEAGVIDPLIARTGKRMEKFDVCVIGCGPGGFAAAMRAFDFGKTVCLIEGGNIGGAGIMHGALTSKTLWELAKDYAIAGAVDRGYRVAGLMVDYQAVRDTVIQAAKEKQYQILSQIETFSPPRWKGPGSITLKRGFARFIDPHTVTLSSHGGKEEEVHADNFVIATGSKPRDFPGIRLDNERIINSDGILAFREFPKRLLILGAGIVGCEYASIFSNFGQTQVHLLDRQPRIIPFEDEDVGSFVSQNLEHKGVVIHHNAILRNINKNPDFLEIVVDYEDGRSQVLEVDAVLVSVGRTPNLGLLGLDRVGLVQNARGALDTDKDCRVKDNIYAVGDVTQHSALYNVAEMEGRYAVKAMYGKNKYALRYHNMSTIMFFNPEVAVVGLNEQQCQAQKIPYRVAYYSNALVNRAIAMRRTDGFVKILVSEDGQNRILGMRAAGPQASSTIMVIANIMDQDRGLEEIMKSIHPHPSITEGIQECLRLMTGKSIYKPLVFPDYMHIRVWSPENGYSDVAAMPG